MTRYAAGEYQGTLILARDQHNGEYGEALRQLLQRRDLAAARHRAAMARLLGVNATEMLAIAHLAQRGALPPSELAALLQLSSAGVTAMIQRLHDAGNLVRERHPSDRRSILVDLSPAIVERAEHALAPLVRDLQQLAEEVPEAERMTIARFLTRVALISEDHADRLLQDVQQRAASRPLLHPGLWG